MKRAKRQMKMEVIQNGRAVPKALHAAVLVDASARFRARQQTRMQGRISRLPSAPDRASVAKAMLMVEVHLVKAFWTIARQPLGTVAPLDARQCGIGYIHERERGDTGGYRDAAGGDWSSIAPRPSLPSSKEIDAANEALDWLLLIDSESLRKVLVIGATSKRGDAGKRIPWDRLRPGMKEHRGVTIRTIQRYYQDALRIIVTELTIARLSPLSHKCA